jgi:hypothetical protein
LQVTRILHHTYHTVPRFHRKADRYIAIMAEAYRIYGWNNGTEPERYRLHVQDYQPAYSSPHNTYGYYGSSPGADYIDRSRYPRTEDCIAPHVEPSRKSRRRKDDEYRTRRNEYRSNEDYIAPPLAESGEDYISQAYDAPPKRRHEGERERRMPGGFYDSEIRVDRHSRSKHVHEDESVKRIISDAKFSNEHEVMRAYWVPGPQEYDEMDLSSSLPRKARSRPGSRSRGSKAKRVTYESEESESDVKTYVDDIDSSEEDRKIVYESDEDDSMVDSGNRSRRRRSPGRTKTGNRWDTSPRMPGGYASSSPSPSRSIHYESDEPRKHTRYRSTSASSDPHTHPSRTTTRYLSSSPGIRYASTSRSTSRHRHASPSPPYGAPSPPTLSDYERRTPSVSPAPRPRPRVRNPRAPYPPSLTTRHFSSSSTPRSSSFLSDRSFDSGTEAEAERERRYLSDSDQSVKVPCRTVKARYVSDEESDFVINGGSECEFEGNDIWCDSSDEDRGGGGAYDDEE